MEIKYFYLLLKDSMITRTITLSSADWTHISFSQTQDDNGFIFWADNDISFAGKLSPTAEEQIPLWAEKMFGFAKPQDFYIKWSIGTKIYLAPFDWVLAGISWTGNDKWYFVDDTALNLAYPVGEDGWYATVGSTDTIWIWDGDTNAWVDSGNPSAITQLIVDTTYANLETIKNSGTLVPWMKYKITDFQNISPLGNVSGEYVTGDLEEIIVTATSTTELSKKAISMQYPQDDITYDFDNNAVIGYWRGYIEQWYSEWDFPPVVTGANTFTVSMPWELIENSDIEMFGEDDNGVYFERYFSDLWTERSYVDLWGNVYEITLTNYTGDLTNIDTWPNGSGYIEIYIDYVAISRNGYIEYRKDTVKNIETNYDFRTCKSRVWNIDTHWKSWNSGTLYNKYDWVKHSDWFIYICSVANSNKMPSNTSLYRIPILYYFNEKPVLTYDGMTQWGGMMVYSSSSNYEDIPILSNNAYEYTDTNVYNFKSIIEWNNYPVIYGNGSNGSNIKNVDLWRMTQSVLGMMDIVEDVRFYGSGKRNTFTSRIQRVNIKYCNNSNLDFIWNWEADEVSYCNVRYTYNVRGDSITRLTCWTANNAEFWYIYELMLGNVAWFSQRFSIKYATNSQFMRLEDATIDWNFYSNTLWYGNKLEISGQFYNNTQSVPTTYKSLRGKYTGFSGNNTITANVDWQFNDFASNNIAGDISSTTAKSQFASNWIATSQFNNNIFVSFRANGSSGNPLQWYIQNNNINTFQMNTMPNSWAQVYANIMRNISACTIEWDIRDNQISNFQAVTVWPSAEIKNNIMNEFTWHSSFTPSVAGLFQYNNGNRLQMMKFIDFQKNTFNNIQWLDLTSATIVADGSFSKEIIQRLDGTYRVKWVDNSDNQNIDTITT